MIYIIIIIYLLIGILYASISLKKFKKWKSKYDPNDNSGVEFTIGDFILSILLWIFLLPNDIKL